MSILDNKKPIFWELSKNPTEFGKELKEKFIQLNIEIDEKKIPKQIFTLKTKHNVYSKKVLNEMNDLITSLGNEEQSCLIVDFMAINEFDVDLVTAKQSIPPGKLMRSSLVIHPDQAMFRRATQFKIPDPKKVGTITKVFDDMNSATFWLLTGILSKDYVKKCKEYEEANKNKKL